MPIDFNAYKQNRELREIDVPVEWACSYEVSKVLDSFYATGSRQGLHLDAIRIFTSFGPGALKIFNEYTMDTRFDKSAPEDIRKMTYEARKIYEKQFTYVYPSVDTA